MKSPRMLVNWETAIILILQATVLDQSRPLHPSQHPSQREQSSTKRFCRYHQMHQYLRFTIPSEMSRLILPRANRNLAPIQGPRLKTSFFLVIVIEKNYYYQSSTCLTVVNLGRTRRYNITNLFIQARVYIKRDQCSVLSSMSWSDMTSCRCDSKIAWYNRMSCKILNI